MSDERNCGTCAHRIGILGWECIATRYFCSTETKYGGNCRNKSGFQLWEPRRPLHRRVIRVFTGAKA